MHDGCATARDLDEMSKRHHHALGDITKTTTGIQVTLETIKEHLIGSYEKPGHAHRIKALEDKMRLSFWQDVGMSAARAAAAFLTVSVLFGGLYLGFEARQKRMIREVVEEVTMARKAPKDPSCPGCAPTVADAR